MKNNIIEPDKVMEQAKKIAETPHAPEDAAAGIFQMLLPIFENHLNGLSKKALRRLIKGLVTHPLEEYVPKGGEKEKKLEKNAFAVGERMLQSKYMMIMETLMSSPEIQEQLEKTVDSVSIGETKQLEEKIEHLEVKTEEKNNEINLEGIKNG